MAKVYLSCAPILLAFAASAHAADSNFAVSTNGTDYSKAFGSRRETTAESTTDFGATAFTISASQAKRKYEDDSFSAVRLAGTIYHDWSDRFYTRTSVSVSSNKPVFAKRELASDFNLKVLPNAVLTVGGKAARYYDNRDVLSWSAGATYYFGGGFATYRFTSHDIDRLGKSHGHLATVRIKDGKGSGSTQLWLGSGSSLHEEEILLSGSKGKFRSVALNRVQPLKGPVSLNISLGRTWYNTATADYRGTKASIGLSFSGRVRP